MVDPFNIELVLLHVVFFIAIPNRRVGRQVVLRPKIGVIRKSIDSRVAAIEMRDVCLNVGRESDGIGQLSAVYGCARLMDVKVHNQRIADFPFQVKSQRLVLVLQLLPDHLVIIGPVTYNNIGVRTILVNGGLVRVPAAQPGAEHNAFRLEINVGVGVIDRRDD